MAKTRAQIEKEFNEFAEKIAKLESLKHELDALDTKGFEADVKLIRAKLKDIGAIGSATRELNLLKEKINKKKSAAICTPDSGLKRRVAHLENLIKDKRKLIGKGPLTKEEIKDIKDIPKLERELRKTEKEIEEHLGSKKVRIDSGVGVLVDAKFDDFISELKAELTEKLKEEEQSLKLKEQIELKEDIDRTKELFAEKASELEEKETREEMIARQELAKEKQKIEEHEKKDEERLAKDLEKRKKDFKKKTDDLVKKYHSLYDKKMRYALQREVKSKFNAALREKVNAIKAGVVEETRKKVLANLMKESAKKLGMVTKETSKKLKENTKDTIERIKAKMHNEMVSQVKSAVKKKEADLRKQLEREYKEKIKEDMKIKQAELEKRKAQMEKFVEEQARRIFK